MQAMTQDRPRATNPGRWFGGVVGAGVTIGICIAARAFQPADGSEFLWVVGLGGLPIAFLGGRALTPAARSGGWLTAVAVGFGFGLIAPPLGAIEVVVFAMLSSTSSIGTNVIGFLALLPIAFVYSYAVAVLTVPAGLLWGLIVRAIPERAFDSIQAGSDALASYVNPARATATSRAPIASRPDPRRRS